MKTIEFFAEARRFEWIIKNHKFSIPDYQRDYSWQKKHVESLITDLESSRKNNMSHFIWSIVLAGWKDDKEIFVIDGQQRLITISLLVASFYKICNELPLKNPDLEERKNELRSSFHYYLTSEEKAKKINIINISRNSNELYSKLINGVKYSNDNLREEEKLFIKNFKIIYDSFKKNLDKYKDEELKLDFIAEMLEVIENISIIPIYVNNEYDAYTIFEVLNDRGLDLNIWDLLKNLLFKKTSSENKEKIKKLWDEMIIVLEEWKITITQFIRHYWISKVKFVREKELYDELKDKIKNLSDKDILDFVTELVNSAKNYKKIYVPQLDNFSWIYKGKNIFTVLEYIDKFKVKQCYPIILVLYNKFLSWDISADNFERYLFEIEKFSFIYIKTDLSPSKIEWYYSEYAIKISNANKWEIDEIFTNLIQELSSELISIDIRKLFDSLIYVKDGNNKLLNYVLQRLELWKNKEFSVNGNTIEHIFPKSDIENFEKLFWTDFETSHFLLNSMWNLTLLTSDDNESLWSEKDFIKKKEIYKESRIQLTSWLNELNFFWLKELKERHLKLFNSFEKIWKI